MDESYPPEEIQPEEAPDIDDVVEVYIDLDYTTYSLLRKEADKAGMPYPTHISNILHKYALGKLRDRPQMT